MTITPNNQTALSKPFGVASSDPRGQKVSQHGQVYSPHYITRRARHFTSDVLCLEEHSIVSCYEKCIFGVVVRWLARPKKRLTYYDHAGSHAVLRRTVVNSMRKVNISAKWFRMWGEHESRGQEVTDKQKTSLLRRSSPSLAVERLHRPFTKLPRQRRRSLLRRPQRSSFQQFASVRRAFRQSHSAGCTDRRFTWFLWARESVIDALTGVLTEWR